MNTVKYGIVKEFDGYIGTIDSNSIMYYFNKNDINDGEVINVGDKVMFKGKTEDKFPKAFYIKKYEEKE